MRRSMRWEAPSIPTSAYDPSLLREQETPLVIGKNWFLDQEIPAGGFVRIQSSGSKTRRRYEKSEWTKREASRRKLTTCLDPASDEDGQSLAGDGTFKKSRSVGKATSKR